MRARATTSLHMFFWHGGARGTFKMGEVRVGAGAVGVVGLVVIGLGVEGVLVENEVVVVVIVVVVATFSNANDPTFWFWRASVLVNLQITQSSLPGVLSKIIAT